MNHRTEGIVVGGWKNVRSGGETWYPFFEMSLNDVGKSE